MRGIVLLVSFFPAIAAMAQNWALLNPAYRYNYSNDGTDTIRHQIRVMDVDTLGADSFRYELNLVAKVCDTCSGPGYNLLLNQPQFMQRLVDVEPNAWRFHDPSEQWVLPTAGLNDTWIFDSQENITATVTDVFTQLVFGSMEPCKTISLSNGDSIVISENHGVLSWNGQQLVGVHGPDVGSLLPSVETMFPYQTGDVVEYWEENGGYNGITGYSGDRRTYRMGITSGVPVGAAMVFSGSYVEHSWSWASSTSTPTYTFDHLTTTGSEWIAGSPEFPWGDLQDSYPGQLVMGRVHTSAWSDPETAMCVARHWISDSGARMIGCQPLEYETGIPDQLILSFNLIDTQPNPSVPVPLMPVGFHFPAEAEVCGPRYRDGIGFEYYGGCYFEWGERYEMIGAVFAGDTIGTVHSVDYIIGLSIPEASRSPFVLQPNPAADQIALVNAAPGSSVRINDAHGRLVRWVRVVSAAEAIDVREMAPGVYLVAVDGQAPQRLIIAR